MLYLANGLRSVNATFNLRGLALRHLPEEKRVALAVDTRLGLLQPTGFRTKDVCSLYGVSARAVNVGIHDWAVCNGIQRLAAITAKAFEEKVNSNGQANGNGQVNGNGDEHVDHSNKTLNDHVVHFAKALQTMNPNELAEAFKIAGSEVIWGALVRTL